MKLYENTTSLENTTTILVLVLDLFKLFESNSNSMSLTLFICSFCFAVATPKQIRELMQVDGLTNDEVKSHLQVGVSST